MNVTPKKILVMVCHPDDETLICFGSLAKFAATGAEITVAFFTDGHQDRLQCSVETCAWLNAKVKIAPEIKPDFEIRWNRELVRQVDQYLVAEQPDLVISHSPAPAEHQEHHFLYNAVVNALYRRGNAASLWLGEPVSRNPDFRPNLFVDITPHIETKLRAIAIHNAFLPRNAYWATQTPGWQDQQPQLQYSEAFRVEYWRL
jgi:LmbE family N-acetylglucosaminyl deacetylase